MTKGSMMQRSRISPARKRQIVDLIKATLHTPTVVLTDRRLTYCSPAGVYQRGIPLRIPHANRIILKCEHLSAHSPTGSMYDRLYPWLFLRAEELGVISPQATDLIECSVGNAGAAFAHVAHELGYPKPTVILPIDIYDARIDQIASIPGTDIRFSPEKIGPLGYVRLLGHLLRERRSRTARLATGRRLHPISKIRKIPVEPYALFVREAQSALSALGYPTHVDFLVFGVGAGNTVSKVGAVLKSQTPAGKVVVIEHAENPFLTLIQGDIEPPVGTSWSEPDYPATAIHGIPVDKLALDRHVIDRVLLTTRAQRDEGWRIANDMLQLRAGRPTGSFLWGALRVAQETENSNILVPVFDSVAKYSWSKWTPVHTLDLAQPTKAQLCGGHADYA